MKNNVWLLLAGFSTLVTLGCDTCSQIAEICDETPSTTYLVEVNPVDYDAIGDDLLLDPTSHLIEVCGYHFASGSGAGDEFDEAMEEWNRQLGHGMSFTSSRTSGHTDAFDFLVSERSSSGFDYVNLDSTVPSKCSLPGDVSYAQRTCRIDMESGETQWFVIFPNSNTYGHFDNLSSTDYPMDHGILHELGHGLGMAHTPSWNAADKQYISTMQGNLKYLSALDVDWLRHHYPGSVNPHRNYVASTLTRFGGTKAIWDEQNPSSFYVDGSSLKDCATQADPWLYAAWFNTGTQDGEDTICGVNSFYLRQKADHSKRITLKTWRIAQMPAVSQDQWKGQVAVTLSAPTAIDYSAEWELCFEVNDWATLDETTEEDNIISMDVTLHSSSGCTGAKARPAKAKGDGPDGGPVRFGGTPGVPGGK